MHLQDKHHKEHKEQNTFTNKTNCSCFLRPDDLYKGPQSLNKVVTRQASCQFYLLGIFPALCPVMLIYLNRPAKMLCGTFAVDFSPCIFTAALVRRSAVPFKHLLCWSNHKKILVYKVFQQTRVILPYTVRMRY